LAILTRISRRSLATVIRNFTSQDMNAARLGIRLATSTSGGEILAYASVVDGKTGDPVFEAATVVE